MGLSEGQLAPQAEVLRGVEMRTPDEVAAMLRLKALGWGIKRIARELGCSHMTVRRYVAQGGYVPYRRPVGRPRALAGLDGWLAERFRRHGGNPDVYGAKLQDLRVQSAEQWMRTERARLSRHAEVANAMDYMLREIINAIFYVLRGGVAWRLLPKDLSPRSREHRVSLVRAVARHGPV